MGTHFRFGPGTTCGVDGQRQLHEGVPAVPEGVVFTCLNPRELERSRDRQTGNSCDQDCRQDRPARARPKQLCEDNVSMFSGCRQHEALCRQKPPPSEPDCVVSSLRPGPGSWGDLRAARRTTCVTGLFCSLSPVDPARERRDRGPAPGEGAAEASGGFRGVLSAPQKARQ